MTKCLQKEILYILYRYCKIQTSTIDSEEKRSNLESTVLDLYQFNNNNNNSCIRLHNL